MVALKKGNDLMTGVEHVTSTIKMVATRTRMVAGVAERMTGSSGTVNALSRQKIKRVQH